MYLVQVNPVGLKSAQRCLTLGDDVPALVPLGIRIVIVHRPVHFGCEHDPIALAVALECLPHDLLATPTAVDVRRIQEVDARIDRAIDNRERVLGVGATAEHHASQALRADLDTSSSQIPVFHVRRSFQGQRQDTHGDSLYMLQRRGQGLSPIFVPVHSLRGRVPGVRATTGPMDKRRALALECRHPLASGRPIEEAVSRVRAFVPRLRGDRSLGAEIEKLEEAIRGGLLVVLSAHRSPRWSFSCARRHAGVGVTRGGRAPDAIVPSRVRVARAQGE